MFCRFAALLFLILTAAGCTQKRPNTISNPAQDAAAGLPQSLPRDDLGREVKLARVPQRIVVIGPGATETVFALGAGNRLVGRDSASDYPPGHFPAGVRGLAVVGDFSGPFLESTVAARPDFIVVQGETYGRARIEDWQKKCGVPVAALSATTVVGVSRGIEKIGAWLRVDGKKVDTVAKRVLEGHDLKNGQQPTAFFEVGRSPLWTSGGGTLIDDVMLRAGLTNIARDVKGYNQYNVESLLARQPDFYIMTRKRQDISREVLELQQQSSLRKLRSVRGRRILTVDPDLVLRPSPRLGTGIRSLYEQAAKHMRGMREQEQIVWNEN